MKKILFLLAILPMMCYGQDSLKVYDIISDGDRVITVSPDKILNYRQFSFLTEEEGRKTTIYPRLTKTIHNYGKSNRKEVYSLEICALSPKPIHIAKGARMILKDKEGSIITLKSYIEQEDKVGNWFVSDVKYHIVSFFVLTSKQLSDISNGDISKLRIEYTVSPKDVLIKSNKLSIFVKEAINRIEKSEKTKDKFLEDF